MAELSYSKQVQGNQGSSSSSNQNTRTSEQKNIYNKSGINQTQGEKVSVNTAHEDVFKGNKSNLANHSMHPFLKNTGQALQNINTSNPFNFIIGSSISSQQKLISTINNIQTNIQVSIDNFLSKFVNISDRVAAVYGDIEKNIRERLSDTYSRMDKIVYEFLGPINSSFEQKEHSKEKQKKDEENKKELNPENKTHIAD